MKHPVESCPLYNTEVRSKFKEAIGKRVEAAKKHEITILSAWAYTFTAMMEHLIFYIVEARNRLVVEDYFKETGFTDWNTLEIWRVQRVEEVVQGIEKTEIARIP